MSDEIVTAAQLFRAHAKWVASFTLKLGAARQAVDDLVQEVFLVAHRRGGYRPGAAKATTWLAEITVRVVSTHRRGERRQRVIPDEGALQGAVAVGPTPDRTAEGRAMLALVERALDELDIGKRAVFVLYELMDESCEDIARGMSIPVGTVHSRLHAARRELQAAFARLEREKRGHE
jgi:RNA polymerase sigma-70 factor, ECF subfamily